MTHTRRRPGARALLAPLIAVALLGAAGPARATSSDCSKAPDGSPCHTECTFGGTCKQGVCVGGQNMPNGTQCATGKVCTFADTCVDGVCTDGQPVVCAPGACGATHCLEGTGCVYDNPCDMEPPPQPDLALSFDLAGRDLTSPVEQPYDLAPDGAPSDGGSDDAAMPDGGPALDLAVGGDLSTPVGPDGGVSDAGVPPGDLPARADGGSDAGVPDLGGPEGGLHPDGGSDAGVPGVDLAEEPGMMHVHGSGCAIAPRAPAPSVLMLLLALALVLRRTRRD